MTIFLSLFVAIVGLLIYAFASNPKVAEVGRLMFGCGLLVFLFLFSGSTINALTRH